MILRISKFLMGALMLGISAFGLWQMAVQNVFSEVRRWTASGGTQEIEFMGRYFEVSARVLACFLVLLPMAFGICGLWLCWSAVRRNRDYAHTS